MHPCAIRPSTAAVAVAVFAAAFLNAPVSAAQDETFELRMAAPIPRGIAHAESLQWWADEVERRTEGRVTFRIFYAGSLVGALETIPAIRDGRIDGGMLAAGFAPAEFPLWTVDSLPFTSEDPHAYMLTFYELYRENEEFRSEFEDNGIRLMFLVPATQAVSGLREAVDTLDDLDGTRLRVLGYAAEALLDLGVQPISIDPTQQYEAIQRGALDGFGSLAFDAIPNFKLNEVAPNIFYTGLGLYSATGVGLSLETWNSLPEDIQTIMQQTAEDYMFEQEPAALMSYEEAACTTILDGGGTVKLAAADAVEAWKADVGDTIRQEWRQTSIDRGVEPDVVDAFYDTYIEKLRAKESKSEYEMGVAACAERSQ